MAVELQVRSETFTLMIVRTLQRRTTCVSPINGIYLDHVEPVPDSARWSATEGGAAELRLPLDVYVVRRGELLAAANRVPDGARSAAGRVELVIRPVIEGGQLVLSVGDVDLGAAGGALGAEAEGVRRLILAASGTAPRVDVSALLASVGIDPATSGGAVVVAGDLVVARFGDLAGPPAPVDHGFAWALFLDAATAQRLVEARIPEHLPPLQGVTRGARWAPSDGAAAIDAFVRAVYEVPDPLICRVDVALRCMLSLPAGMPELRIDTTYGISIDLGAVPFIDDMLETFVQAAINPAAFGGVRTGADSFAITVALPQIVVGGERWRYDGLVAGAAGLVIGGAAPLPVDLSDIVLTTSTKPFSGGSVASLFCSRGDPPTEIPRAVFFSTVATVEYDGAGILCGVEVVPADQGLEDHLTLPKPGVLTDGGRPGKGTIFMAFGAEAANAVNERVLLIISSPRGVRCSDLGRPEHFTIRPDGTVDGGVVLYFDDCNALPPDFGDMTPEQYDRWSGMIWYTYWGLVPGRDYDPDNPPILPETLTDIPAQWDDVAVIPELTVTGTDTGTRLVVIVPEGFKTSRVEIATETLDG